MQPGTVGLCQDLFGALANGFQVIAQPGGLGSVQQRKHRHQVRAAFLGGVDMRLPGRDIVAVTLAIAAPLPSQAQAAPVMPFGELTFMTPTGSAPNTDVVPVWVRFSWTLPRPR